MPDASGACTPPPSAPVGGSVRAGTPESDPVLAEARSAHLDRAAPVGGSVRAGTPESDPVLDETRSAPLDRAAPVQDPKPTIAPDPGLDANSSPAQPDSSRVPKGSASAQPRPATGAHAEVAYLLRELAPIAVGVLARRFGDFDAAEDAVQEAMLAAATQWPDAGLPDNPRGWLIQVAQRRMTDTVRADAARRHREIALAVRDMEQHNDIQPARDDTLTLFVLCCHTSLSPASAIALTLRAVGGLSTEEIARAFLIPESTMAQRISRAKKRLSTLERPFAMPPALAATAWRDRHESVLHVLYVMFTEGHTASGGPSLQRTDLSAEAIRLARMVHRLVPDDPEVTALLALMLLTDARRAARTGPSGELIPLPEQDRTRWNRGQLAEGVRLTAAAISTGLEGPYRIQASIAALHAQARHAEDTDWDRILLLYKRLERLTPNPMVTLNRAVATAMVHGPAAGLTVTDAVADVLTDNHRLDAVRAHLHDMAGDRQAAIACYTAAAHHTASTPERDYLTLRAARLRQ